MSQSRIVPSSAAVASSRPFGLNATNSVSCAVVLAARTGAPSGVSRVPGRQSWKLPLT
jgi:hypothetical protein